MTSVFQSISASVFFRGILAAAQGFAKGLDVIAIGCVATNLACATPVGTPACTQTLPAGYKYMDYMKIGGPLAIILMIAAAALAPVMYPF